MSKPLAVITGASSGIGEVYARRLAPDHDLLLIARNRQRLEALAKELTDKHGNHNSVMDADLSEDSDVKKVAARIGSEPQLALLINNAGFGARGPFWKGDVEVLERMHRLHVNALVRLSHAALAVMVPRDLGGLINLASVAAFARRPGSAAYAATKSWVAAFTEGLYVDLKKAGSRVVVQSLCPGYTYSSFHDVMGEDRTRIAPPSMWLSAEQVVDDSLAALRRGELYVVPGWRYKMIVALMKILPMSLRFRAAASAGAPKAR